MSTEDLRKFPRRPLGMLGAAGAFGAVLGATRPAAAQSIDDVLTKKKLQVGMLVDFPPFGLTDSKGQPDGYDADVAKLMAKYMGVELELVPVTGPNRIPYLLTSKVDILIATFGITPERARQSMFSIPYSSIDIVLLAPKTTKVTSFDDLKTLKVGVARASTQDTAITAKAPPGTHIMRFDDDATAIQAILSRQVDAVGVGTLIAKQLRTMNPSANYEDKLVLRHQPNGITLRRGQYRPARLDQHLHLLHQEQRRAGRDLPQVAGHPAARTAGVLNRGGRAAELRAPRPPRNSPRENPPCPLTAAFACPAGCPACSAPPALSVPCWAPAAPPQRSHRRLLTKKKLQVGLLVDFAPFGRHRQQGPAPTATMSTSPGSWPSTWASSANWCR